MNLNSIPYIQQFLADLEVNQVYNDATPYRVQIQEAQVADGEQYWRVIGVHHLLPAENERNHTILVEALDEQGNRIRQGRVHAASTFENNRDPDKVTALDKGDTDPMGCDFPMGKEATYSVWMKGDRPNAKDPSDRVEKLHTRHKDEASGNTIGHHSFFVAFQRTRKGPTVLDKNAMLDQAHILLEQQMAGDTPLAVYARTHDLGAPITPEFSAGGFRARGYVGGVVFAPLAKVADVAHVSW
jgi:hypothetical protein